jgi:alkylated DNA repair dioxygenase AlkB
MKIQGLEYIEEFISDEEEVALISEIDNNGWLNDLKRRVQHYGYKYDYKKRNIDPSMKIGNLPGWVEELVSRLKELGNMPYLPDQLIVNEYLPGQGISPHIDCEPCFGNTIASLSLGSHCVMKFSNKSTQKEFDLMIKPKSLLIMQDEARYKWHHGINARKTDVVEGIRYARRRRISLTFRKVNLLNSL